MRVVVTGSNGMLGGALTRALSGTEAEVVGLSRKDCDLRDYNSVLALFDSLKPTHVIHSAALVGGLYANIANKLNFATQNLSIDSNVLAGAANVGVDCFVNFGSSCMYDPSLEQPFNEESLDLGRFEETNYGYALAKYSSLKAVALADRELNGAYKSLILPNLFGPGDNYSQNNSHVVAAAIQKVSRAKLHGQEVVEILGDGTPKREFLFVDDVATFLSKNLEETKEFPSFMNLGSGEEISVEEVFKKVAELLGWTGTFSFSSNSPKGVPRKLMNSSKASSLHGWTPATDFESGLALAIRDAETRGVVLQSE